MGYPPGRGAGWQFERNLTESITGNTVADKGVESWYSRLKTDFFALKCSRKSSSLALKYILKSDEIEELFSSISRKGSILVMTFFFFFFKSKHSVDRHGSIFRKHPGFNTNREYLTENASQNLKTRTFCLPFTLHFLKSETSETSNWKLPHLFTELYS